MEETFDSKPKVCFQVEKIIGISNEGNYQVQWAPAWVSRYHLVGCEHLIQEFLQHQQSEIEANRQTRTDAPDLTTPCLELPSSSEISDIVKQEPDIQLEYTTADTETDSNYWGDLQQSNDESPVQPADFGVGVKEENIPAMALGLYGKGVSVPVSSSLDANTSCSNASSVNESNIDYEHPDAEAGVSNKRMDGASKHQNNKYSELYSCDQCGYSCSRKPDLTVHMRTHASEKPFACNTCKKSFTTRGSLKSHMYTHTGERPYPCSFCDSKFTLSCNLRRHLLTHTSERPYKCDQCPKSFCDQSNWKRHRLIHARATKQVAGCGGTIPGARN